MRIDVAPEKRGGGRRALGDRVPTLNVGLVARSDWDGLSPVS
jgi:hypothetical protein